MAPSRIARSVDRRKGTRRTRPKLTAEVLVTAAS